MKHYDLESYLFIKQVKLCSQDTENPVDCPVEVAQHIETSQ